jgi:hypothetical protein
MINTITLRATIILLACSYFILQPGVSPAQDSKIELTPFAGYMLGGSIKFYEGKFKIKDDMSYGGMLAYRLQKGNLIELSYTRMDSQGDWRPYSGYIGEFPEKTVDVAMNYLQIGTVNELMTGNDQLRPYGTFSLGAAWLHGKETTAKDEWLFAVNAGVGLKYFFAPRIGIRLQARLMLPLVFSGAGFYLGVGTGGPSAGVGTSSFAPIVQGDFTGGLIIALGD